MDRRSLRAALLADLIAFVVVAGLGIFLGFPALGSVVAGALAGTLAFALLFAASARAETFTGPEHLPPPPADEHPEDPR